MTLIDSSVWIDYFNGKRTPPSDWLHNSMGKIPLIIGDLILTEVLQGFQREKDFKIAKKLLLSLHFMPMGGRDLAIQSAVNYRLLRSKGVTVRKTIDVMIGSFCIYHDIPLLHDDRDFDPMVKHLGLKVVK